MRVKFRLVPTYRKTCEWRDLDQTKAGTAYVKSGVSYSHHQTDRQHDHFPGNLQTISKFHQMQIPIDKSSGSKNDGANAYGGTDMMKTPKHHFCILIRLVPWQSARILSG